MAKKKNEYYVDNKKFSEAVQDYAYLCRKAKERGDIAPKVPVYVWECIQNIAEGLSRKGNFMKYSYRDDFVQEGIEDCLKALPNYNIDTETRTGKPNAFSYFTQCCYWAYVRRINKENKEIEGRISYLKEMSAEGAADKMIGDGSQIFNDGLTTFAHSVAANNFNVGRRALLDLIEDRNDDLHEDSDSKPLRRRRDTGDSDLNDFLQG